MKSLAFAPPFFFQLEGSLQMEKSSAVTSLSEAEYDEETEEGQAPEASRVESSFRPTQGPKKID